jgi:hypothetical protein
MPPPILPLKTEVVELVVVVVLVVEVEVTTVSPSFKPEIISVLVASDLFQLQRWRFYCLSKH